MPESSPFADVAGVMRSDIAASASGTKRLRLRTLLGKFGYVKRSDTNTAEITKALTDAGLSINPPIVRFGDDWEITTEEWIYLSISPMADPVKKGKDTVPLPKNWNADGWFDRVATMELRTEKEVEIKFIVPLLARLGFVDADRFDGMPIPAANGSRKTTLVIDFACFNSEVEGLRSQPLLTVEAKKEHRLSKEHELLSAHNQAKSYCMWTQCDYFLVTDSRTIHAYHVARGGVQKLSPVFECGRHDLGARFGELYGRLSKDVLTGHYMKRLAVTEEAH
jgi:hypothetical protein